MSARDAECRRLAELYDLEGYLFNVVSPRFQRDGTLQPYDFFAIIIWKSNRSKTNIKRGLAAARTSATELMSQVSEAPTALAKLDALVRIPGIGLAIASAILTVCYPEQFTVLDYRAWDTAKKERIGGLPDREPQTPTEYLQYCQACQRFAARLGMSLRDLDRALWAKSWERDLQRLISGRNTMSGWIILPYGGLGAKFPVQALIDHIKGTGRDHIVRGQTKCTLEDHPKPQSLDVWLRTHFTHKRDTMQAVNQVVDRLVATGLFQVEKRPCPDSGRSCKGIALVGVEDK